ncbi:MAG: hypothetical protein HY331_08085 [Chloroflexi bacterium]|nr:hypothetical protein [Chloroflexota bacterium]
MTDDRPAWHLMKRRAVFGTLTFERVEGGWTFCTFEPTQAFDALKDTFEEEVILLETEPFDEARWQRAARKIHRLRLTLRPVSGGAELDAPLLHIEGDRAWFRAG